MFSLDRWKLRNRAASVTAQAEFPRKNNVGRRQAVRPKVTSNRTLQFHEHDWFSGFSGIGDPVVSFEKTSFDQDRSKRS